MTCTGQPSISNGYPTGAASGTPPTVTFVCNPGYTLSGNPTYACHSGNWTGNAECAPWYIKDVWFWLLIAVGSLVAIGVITALCVYCCKRCCWRNRIRRVNPVHDEEYPPGVCGGCCDYGGSCDICGCVDFYGCCSLYGCCGYQGVCGFGLCTCCRCCREPDDNHVHENRSQNVKGRKQKRWAGILSKRTVMKARRKRRDLWRRWRSNRPENPMDDEVYDKVRRNAKVMALWLPHSNPIRSINTSTK
ncbi:uncharacterized protein LOC125657228 isoform X2 [Ostrea edulis]|uniref:uncharacterized protein LOC125657228 isoform X2 n=1 Tax=Ostrea edulis TaxID=37623 RepID=UPI0020953F89|nr:uncharacterized protein LOC125657228 isoform X2 [Ostrea edulis]